MRRFVTIGPSLAVLFAVAVTLAAGPEIMHRMRAASISAQATLAQQRLDADDLLERINQSVRDVAKAVEPSVVFVEIRDRSGRGLRQAQGSGWIYDDSGHIVTNNHVIQEADAIRVHFFDGRVAPADFVGRDISTDIAVIRVGGDEDLLVPAQRATGEPLYQGDTVFAFGSPFGYKFSMSQGIVSGLGREAVAGNARNRYTNFIQTDAAVNPGNSGGPLVDVDGRVVGMNTAIITDERAATRGRSATGVSGGIGFAIPLTTIESVVEQIIERGVVRKGYLGVQLSELNFDQAAQMGFDAGGGVLISGVTPGTPADDAGLLRGDIIVRVDSRRIPSLPVLRSVVGHQPPGETVGVTVWREGELVEKQVTLAAAAIDASGQLRPLVGEGRAR